MDFQLVRVAFRTVSYTHLDVYKRQLLIKMGFQLPPMILGFILAPTIETNLRRGLQLSNGDITPFFTRPISAVFLLIAALSILFSVIGMIRKNAAAKAQKEAS